MPHFWACLLLRITRYVPNAFGINATFNRILNAHFSKAGSDLVFIQLFTKIQRYPFFDIGSIKF